MVDELICSICTSLAKKPVQLPCCARICCRICAFKSLSTNQQRCWFPGCPVTKVLYDHLRPVKQQPKQQEQQPLPHQQVHTLNPPSGSGKNDQDKCDKSTGDKPVKKIAVEKSNSDCETGFRTVEVLKDKVAGSNLGLKPRKEVSRKDEWITKYDLATRKHSTDHPEPPNPPENKSSNKLDSKSKVTAKHRQRLKSKTKDFSNCNNVNSFPKQSSHIKEPFKNIKKPKLPQKLNTSLKKPETLNSELKKVETLNPALKTSTKFPDIPKISLESPNRQVTFNSTQVKALTSFLVSKYVPVSRDKVANICQAQKQYKPTQENTMVEGNKLETNLCDTNSLVGDTNLPVEKSCDKSPMVNIVKTNEPVINDVEISDKLKTNKKEDLINAKGSKSNGDDVRTDIKEREKKEDEWTNSKESKLKGEDVQTDMKERKSKEKDFNTTAMKENESKEEDVTTTTDLKESKRKEDVISKDMKERESKKGDVILTDTKESESKEEDVIRTTDLKDSKGRREDEIMLAKEIQSKGDGAITIDMKENDSTETKINSSESESFKPKDLESENELLASAIKVEPNTPQSRLSIEEIKLENDLHFSPKTEAALRPQVRRYSLEDYSEYIEDDIKRETDRSTKSEYNDFNTDLDCSKLKKKDDLSNALVIPGLSKEECFQVSDVIALAVIDVQVVSLENSYTYSQVGLCINILGLHNQTSDSLFFSLKPPGIGDLSVKVYLKLLEKLRVRRSTGGNHQYIKSTDSLFLCVDYQEMVNNIVQELKSLLTFSAGIVLAYTSARLVFPLISSILAVLPTSSTIVGVVDINQILRDTFSREQSLDMLSICNEVLDGVFNLDDAMESSRVLFELARSLVGLDFDGLIAPYVTYKPSLLTSAAWVNSSYKLSLDHSKNIRIVISFQEDLVYELDISTGNILKDSLPLERRSFNSIITTNESENIVSKSNERDKDRNSMCEPERVLEDTRTGSDNMFDPSAESFVLSANMLVPTSPPDGIDRNIIFDTHFVTKDVQTETNEKGDKVFKSLETLLESVLTQPCIQHHEVNPAGSVTPNLQDHDADRALTTSPFRQDRALTSSPFTQANRDPNPYNIEPKHLVLESDSGPNQPSVHLTVQQDLAVQQNWRHIQAVVERTNRHNLSCIAETETKSQQGIRFNNSIFDLTSAERMVGKVEKVEEAEEVEEEPIFIPKETDSCKCDTLELCTECRSFQVQSVFGCGGRFHAGTVLCNIQDDDRDCVDKYVRFIDGASFSQGGDRASINNQMCEVVDGKYIVLVLKHTEKKTILPAVIMGICQIWKGVPSTPKSIDYTLSIQSSLTMENQTVLNCSLSPPLQGRKVPLFLEIKPELPVKLANRFCSIDLQGRVKVIYDTKIAACVPKFGDKVGTASTKLRFSVIPPSSTLPSPKRPLPSPKRPVPKKRKVSEVVDASVVNIGGELLKTLTPKSESKPPKPINIETTQHKNSKLQFGVKKSSPLSKKNVLEQTEFTKEKLEGLKMQKLTQKYLSVPDGIRRIALAPSPALVTSNPSAYPQLPLHCVPATSPSLSTSQSSAYPTLPLPTPLQNPLLYSTPPPLLPPPGFSQYPPHHPPLQYPYANYPTNLGMYNQFYHQPRANFFPPHTTHHQHYHFSHNIHLHTAPTTHQPPNTHHTAAQTTHLPPNMQTAPPRHPPVTQAPYINSNFEIDRFVPSSGNQRNLGNLARVQQPAVTRPVISLPKPRTARLCPQCVFDTLEDVSFDDGTDPCPGCPLLTVRLLENPTLLVGKPAICVVRVQGLDKKKQYIKLFTRGGVLSCPLFQKSFPPPKHQLPVLCQVDNTILQATIVNHSLEDKLLMQGTVVAAAQRVFIKTGPGSPSTRSRDAVV